jgi:hypothetical protein
MLSPETAYELPFGGRGDSGCEFSYGAMYFAIFNSMLNRWRSPWQKLV